MPSYSCVESAANIDTVTMKSKTILLIVIALTTIISFFRRGFRPRHMLTINRVAGVVISALGVIALVSQFV